MIETIFYRVAWETSIKTTRSLPMEATPVVGPILFFILEAPYSWRSPENINSLVKAGDIENKHGHFAQTLWGTSSWKLY